MPDELDKARAEVRTELTLAAMDQLNLPLAEAADAIQHVRWRDVDLDKGTVLLPRRLPDLHPEIIAALQRQAAEMSDRDGMLFDNRANRDDKD